MPNLAPPPIREISDFAKSIQFWLKDVRDIIYGTIVTITSSTHTVTYNEKGMIANRSGTITVTLPPASISRTWRVKTITANTVISASSNVVPLAGGSAGTAILSATAGKWAILESDGTNWQIMAAN